MRRTSVHVMIPTGRSCSSTTYTLCFLFTTIISMAWVSRAHSNSGQQSLGGAGLQEVWCAGGGQN